MHPGPEHGEDTAGLKGWNVGEHRRKFLCCQGQALADLRAGPRDDDLVFWGEWEAQSEVEPIPLAVGDGPCWLHRPYYVRPGSYQRDGQVLQNTDPFVFGETFFYTLCRQLKPRGGRWKPTFLRDLAPGSLILFGSLKRGEFVLDTVYVVEDSILHRRESWEETLAGAIPDVYADVTMRPSYAWGGADELRLYQAAMHSRPLDGMFSFVPCLPAEHGAVEGFARPSIRLTDVVTSNLMMGAKATRNLSIGRVRALWEDVVGQVLDQGLMLATRIALPERRES